MKTTIAILILCCCSCFGQSFSFMDPVWMANQTKVATSSGTNYPYGPATFTNAGGVVASAAFGQEFYGSGFSTAGIVKVCYSDGMGDITTSTSVYVDSDSNITVICSTPPFITVNGIYRIFYTVNGTYWYYSGFAYSTYTLSTSPY